jgi:hypothetical protein
MVGYGMERYIGAIAVAAQLEPFCILQGQSVKLPFLCGREESYEKPGAS